MKFNFITDYNPYIKEWLQELVKNLNVKSKKLNQYRKAFTADLRFLQPFFKNEDLVESFKAELLETEEHYVYKFSFGKDYSVEVPMPKVGVHRTEFGEKYNYRISHKRVMWEYALRKVDSYIMGVENQLRAQNGLEETSPWRRRLAQFEGAAKQINETTQQLEGEK